MAEDVKARYPAPSDTALFLGTIHIGSRSTEQNVDAWVDGDCFWLVVGTGKLSYLISSGESLTQNEYHQLTMLLAQRFQDTMNGLIRMVEEYTECDK